MANRHNTSDDITTDFLRRGCQYSFSDVLQYFSHNLQCGESQSKDYKRCLLQEEEEEVKVSQEVHIPTSTADMEEVLGLVGMEQFKIYLYDRDNYIKDWGNSISPGEQQRLAVARLLLKKPRLVIV